MPCEQIFRDEEDNIEHYSWHTYIYDCLGSTTNDEEKKNEKRDELLNTRQTLWFLPTTVNSICIYILKRAMMREEFFFEHNRVRMLVIYRV